MVNDFDTFIFDSSIRMMVTVAGILPEKFLVVEKIFIPKIFSNFLVKITFVFISKTGPVSSRNSFKTRKKY